MHGEKVRICTPEDLIIHKIVSDRIRDREDIRGVIHSVGSRLDRNYLDPIIKNLAKILARPELIKFYRSCFHQG